MKEKIKSIVENYHCSGDELCSSLCEQCKDDLKKELEELVGLAKAEGYNKALDECIELLESEKRNYKIIAKLEQLKGKNNE